MRYTSALLQGSFQITLFTRPGCGLCDTAKAVLSRTQKIKPFNLKEIDITAHGQQQWRNVYDFDVPVVRNAEHVAQSYIGLLKIQIHVDKTPPRDVLKDTTGASAKLMHRFSEQDIIKVMDTVASCTAT